MRACFLVLFLAFFITIDQVELKNSSGEWVTVIRPDRRVDLAAEEPAVRFFNNGRIPTGQYSNVRVRFTPEEGARRQVMLERNEDYAKPIGVKKGTFIGVSFSFDWAGAPRVSADAVKEVRLVVDQEERVDGSGNIKLWS